MAFDELAPAKGTAKSILGRSRAEKKAAPRKGRKRSR
jgi:hypothetical protein